MKKAKIMLTAIAVFAVVGGALAFKARSSYSNILYTGTQPNVCPNATLATTTAQGQRLVYTGTQPNVCPIATFTTTHP